MSHEWSDEALERLWNAIYPDPMERMLQRAMRRFKTRLREQQEEQAELDRFDWESPASRDR
jgi:hypothetical protein